MISGSLALMSYPLNNILQSSIKHLPVIQHCQLFILDIFGNFITGNFSNFGALPIHKNVFPRRRNNTRHLAPVRSGLLINEINPGAPAQCTWVDFVDC